MDDFKIKVEVAEEKLKNAQHNLQIVNNEITIVQQDLNRKKQIQYNLYHEYIAAKQNLDIVLDEVVAFVKK